MALAKEVDSRLAMAASVFEVGKLSVDVITRKPDKEESSPPKPVLIVTPTDVGQYPVIFFLHGFLLNVNSYRQLLSHVASHGYIVVAPQLHKFHLCMFNCPCSKEDVNHAAAVTNWLSDGLESALPTGVKANLFNSKIALAGHSRGGHAAFSLALGYAKTELKLKFSVLMGIDPVAGPDKSTKKAPEILSYKPKSFDLGIPVLVFGSGLGEKRKFLIFPASAPEGVNHVEFYNECQPPCCHMVVTSYGHLDMLDDDALKFAMIFCESGNNGRDLMRRATGGIVTAFLKAYLGDDKTYLKAIVDHPEIAPAELSDISYDDII